MNRAKGINVLPLLCFKFSEYRKNKTAFINQIMTAFETDVIVRSSAQNEDQTGHSNAGVYKSVLNVKLKPATLMQAIETVGKDYQHPDDEILIQPMLYNILISGVIFTRDHSTGAPYYIINYTNDGKTDTITSGSAQGQKIIISRAGKLRNLPPEVPMKQLLQATRKIEHIFNSDALDIEFAFNAQKELYILQVRPLIVQAAYSRAEIPDNLFFERLNALYHEIRENNKHKPHLNGKRSIYSMMADWNPAEMIGSRPNLLALSLYKTLITDNIWAMQRHHYGYKNVSPHPLLYAFMGCPYIDIRTDFNSFLPAELSQKTAEKIMQYYLDSLQNRPELHDKVEFCILFTCATLTTRETIEKKLAHILTPKQIKEFLTALREITDRVFASPTPLYQKDIVAVKKLEAQCAALSTRNISFEEKISGLLDLCRTYGTLPFAGIARTAFIGRQFLDSFLEKGIISKQNYRNFVRSIPIISQKIQADANKLHNKNITKKSFLSKWGHLRPNSYDILSLRYDEDFASYFDEKYLCKPVRESLTKYSFNRKQLQQINTLLAQEGLHFSAEHLLKCIKESIAWREDSKFIFTKILSQILSLIKEYAHTLSLSEKDMANISVFDIIKQFDTATEKKAFLENKIKANRSDYIYTKCVKLPEVLTSPADIYYFEQNENIPNFVTQRKIKANVVAEEEIHTTACARKVICIRSADPGYDFIFTKNIAGLITQFGGANSHMAIRCLEQNIPAVIGVGEKKFNELRQANLIEIDALNKQVRIIR